MKFSLKAMENDLSRDGWGFKGIGIRLLFVGIPLGAFCLPYWKEGLAIPSVLAIAFTLALFLVFAFKFRRTEFVASGSLAPAIGGPFLTTLALRGAKQAELLRVMNEMHGSFLIEMSFYLSGLFGLLIYTRQRFLASGASEREKRLANISYATVALSFMVIILASAYVFAPPEELGPQIVWNLRFPSFSLLLVLRLVLIVASLLFILEPRDDDGNGSPDGK